PFTNQQREVLLRLCQPGQATVAEICAMNFKLGELFAEATLELLKKAQLSPDEVSVIGSHGQTIYHIPGESTLQIGEPAIIAQRTGITTVADFRPADIAAGGQGAPLVPYFDQIIFGKNETSPVTAVQNIGGIGNVTVVGNGTDTLPWIAFDTGPGNMVIDAVVHALTKGAMTYDDGGQMAGKGKVDAALLAQLMQDPYFNQPLPKTTGRERFGAQFSASLLEKSSLPANDLVATVTAFTAESILDQYRRFILPHVALERVIIGGGGSRNITLLTMIKERLGCPIYVHEDFGISSDAKEAMAFAMLADATLRRAIGNVPRATGASRGAVLGKIVFPGVKSV
ncbi:MAG: anhydro-N-acetylmuramic acid kinase, partial [Limnochordia bacterium]|nr:anhydro-N-acetylmuramic acid kinase [Limnochordia bacterium]